MEEAFWFMEHAEFWYSPTVAFDAPPYPDPERSPQVTPQPTSQTTSQDAGKLVFLRFLTAPDSGLWSQMTVKK